LRGDCGLIEPNLPDSHPFPAMLKPWRSMDFGRLCLTASSRRSSDGVRLSFMPWSPPRLPPGRNFWHGFPRGSRRLRLAASPSRPCTGAFRPDGSRTRLKWRRAGRRAFEWRDGILSWTAGYSNLLLPYLRTNDSGLALASSYYAARCAESCRSDYGCGHRRLI